MSVVSASTGVHHRNWASVGWFCAYRVHQEANSCQIRPSRQAQRVQGPVTWFHFRNTDQGRAVARCWHQHNVRIGVDLRHSSAHWSYHHRSWSRRWLFWQNFGDHRFCWTRSVAFLSLFICIPKLLFNVQLSHSLRRSFQSCWCLISMSQWWIASIDNYVGCPGSFLTLMLFLHEMFTHSSRWSKPVSRSLRPLSKCGRRSN